MKRKPKQRIHAGERPLQATKRNIKEITLLALEVIHDQCQEGTIMLDLQYRCEMNLHYARQVIRFLLDNQLAQAQDGEGDYQKHHTYYYMTQKGEEWRNMLKEQLASYGYKPTINARRKPAHFSDCFRDSPPEEQAEEN